MSKNWILALLTVLVLIGASAFFAVFAHHQRHQAHLYVGVSGGNATVKMSSYDFGSTPVKNATLAPGWYDFQLHTDFYDYTLPVRLSPQTATVIDWQMGPTLETSSGVIYELTPIGGSTASLTVVTIPENTQLTLDDQRPNQPIIAPLIEESLTPGSHTLSVSLPGYDTRDIPLTLTAGYELKLTVKLAQNQGIL